MLSLSRSFLERLRQYVSLLGSSAGSVDFFAERSSASCGGALLLDASVAGGGGGGAAEGMSSLVKTFLGLGAVFCSARALRAASATGSPVEGCVESCCADAVNAATLRIADRADRRQMADVCMVTF